MGLGLGALRAPLLQQRPQQARAHAALLEADAHAEQADLQQALSRVRLTLASLLA